MSWLRKYFMKDLGLKALAFAGALALWASVSLGPLPEAAFDAAVRYVNIPPDLELNPDQAEKVTVILRGPRRQLQGLQGLGVQVEVDFAEAYGPGEKTHNVEARNLRLPRGVDLVKAVPSQLRFSLEKRAHREVEVQPRFVGAYEPGYGMEGFTVNPPRLTIIGPENRVGLVDQVTTDPIDLSDVIGSRSFRAMAYVPDPYLRFEQHPAVTVEVRMRKR